MTNSAVRPAGHGGRAPSSLRRTTLLTGAGAAALTLALATPQAAHAQAIVYDGGADVTIGSGSSQNYPDGVIIGDFSDATFLVEDGGDVTSGGQTFLGGTATGIGTLTVDGVGSTWANGGQDMSIGGFGQGTVNVTNGGSISGVGVAVLGFDSGASGAVTVDGVGSTFSADTGIFLGQTGAGALTVSGGGLIVVNGGAGALFLAIGGSSTGTLNIGAGGAAGTISASSINLGSGAAEINFNHNATSGASHVFSPAITGDGTVNILTGHTTLNADSDYTGFTSLQGGTLRLAHSNAAGTSLIGTAGAGAALSYAGGVDIANTLTVDDDLSLEVLGADFATQSGGISGSAGVTKTGDGSLRLNGVNTFSGLLDVSRGAVILAGGSAVADSAAVTVTGGGWSILGVFNDETIGSLGGDGDVELLADLTTGGDGSDTDLSGRILGSGGLIKTGAGAMTLSTSGTSTYSGGTTVSGGVLGISRDAQLGGASGGVTFNNSSTLRFTNTSDITLGAGRTIAINGAGQTGVFDVSGLGAVIVAGQVTGDGGFVKDGFGILELTGAANDYLGDTTIRNGLLVAGSDAVLGDPGGDIVFGGFAGLRQTAGFDTARNVVLDFSAVIQIMSGSAEFSGLVSGAANISKGGAGTLELTNTANTYQMGTTVSAGALRVSATGALGRDASSNPTTELRLENAATLEIGGSDTFDRLLALGVGGGVIAVDDGEAAVWSGRIDGAGTSLTKRGDGALRLTGGANLMSDLVIEGGDLEADDAAPLGTATVTLNGGVLRTLGAFSAGNSFAIAASGGTIDTDAGGLTLNGLLSGSGALTKSGANTLLLTDTNIYAGALRIDAGAVALRNGDALGDAADVDVDSGATLSVENDETIDGLSGSGSVDLTPGSLTVGGGGATTTFDGVISGSGGLTKAGAGTLTLTGDNIFTGGLFVSDGVLELMSANNFTGGVRVGGTLHLGDDDAAGANLIRMVGSILDYADGVTIANAVQIESGTTQLSVASGTATQSGAITQDGLSRPLAKIGAGALILTNAGNAWNGLTSVHDGDLVFEANAMLGDISIGPDFADDGELIVRNAATVQAANVAVGADDAEGELQVLDDAQLNAVQLVVGAGGEGELEISGGGAVTADTVEIGQGDFFTGAGEAVVSGSGSRLTALSGLTVGVGGLGSLKIAQGGVVRAEDGAGNPGEVLLAADFTATGLLAIGGSGNCGCAPDDPEAPGVLEAASVRAGDGYGELLFNHTGANYGFAPALEGLLQVYIARGATRLTGNSAGFAGAILVGDPTDYAGNFLNPAAAPHLIVDGVIGGVVPPAGPFEDGIVFVLENGVLSGTGAINGMAFIGEDPGGVLGALNATGALRGASGGDLDFGGLWLGADATLDVTLGAPGGGALFNVDSELTLDGAIDVIQDAGFAGGSYRLIGYADSQGSGYLDNGIGLGDVTGPVLAGDLDLLIQSDGVYLINSAGLTVRFWDGAGVVNNTVDGGAGTWTATDTNWTSSDGVASGAFDTGEMAAFAGPAGGTVMLSDSFGPLEAAGLEFVTDGYILQGNPLELTDNGTVSGRIDAGAGVTAMIFSSITGSVGIERRGPGTVALNGPNSFTGTVSLLGGVTIIGSNAGLGDAGNAVLMNGGALRTFSAIPLARSITVAGAGGAFDVAGDPLTVLGSITGAGPLAKTGVGAMTLSGANNAYTGAFTVSGGDVLWTGGAAMGDTSAVTVNAGSEITSDGPETIGSLAGAGDFVIASGALTAGGNNGSTTFSGVMSGNGGLTKAGTGTMTLTGVSTYDGATTVNGGTLVVNGSLLSAVTVGGSGKLMGSGSVASATATGIVAPGNSIGTLSIAGGFTFATGSTYEVEIAANGTSDLIAATGAVSIQNGTTVQVLALDPLVSYQGGQEYTIVTAGGGVTGAFTTLNDSAFLDTELIYTANTVRLGIVPQVTPVPTPLPPPPPGVTPPPAPPPVMGFPSVALTPNQAQAAAGASFLGQTGDSLAVYNTILPMNAAQARAAFDALSGESHATFRHAAAEGAALFQTTLARRSGGVFADASGGVSERRVEGSNIWGAALVSAGKIDADGNAAELEHQYAGLAFGAEGGRDAGGGVITGGLAAGFLDGRGSTDGRMSAADISSWHGGAYGAWDNGALRVSGATTYSSAEIESTRLIAWTGLNRTTAAERDAETFGMELEAAYRLPAGAAGFSVAPLVVLDYLAGSAGAARETGAGSLDLTVAEKDYNRLEAGVGVALFQPVRLASGALGLDGRLVYRSVLDGEAPVQGVALAGAPNAAYAVYGPDMGGDRVELGLGVSAALGERFSLSARYDGALGESAEAHRASVTASWGF